MIATKIKPDLLIFDRVIEFKKYSSNLEYVLTVRKSGKKW